MGPGGFILNQSIGKGVILAMSIGPIGQGASGLPTPAATGSVSATNGVTPVTSATAAISQNMFLQLIMDEMKNQDPTQPMDNTQMISQLAQMQTLQAQTQLNDSLNALTDLTQLGQAAGLIGKTVQTAATAANNNTPVSGVVSAAGITNGVATLTVGSQTINLSDVVSVTA